MRLSLLLLLTTLAFAQSRGATSPATPDQNGTEPELPVIDENACPFEGCTFKEWEVTNESPLYSTWQDGRTQIGKLNAGERVLGLTGTHITRRPDRILVKRAISELSLNSGDIILRYMYVGEGFANIWAKGVWHKEYDCSFIYEGSGSGCVKNCAAEVIEMGLKEWWVKVKTANATTGWVLENDNFEGMDILAKFFGEERNP